MIQEIASRAKVASVQFLKSSADDRNNVLRKIASLIRSSEKDILIANGIDLKRATGLSPAMKDRLSLTSSRIEAMAKAAEDIANQEEVVGKVVSQNKRHDGLLISRKRVPLGVIAMIFESRPNVVIDCACLAIKSGNAIILKGGKEAEESNSILSNLVRTALDGIIPQDVVQTLSSSDRAAIAELIQLPEYINVVIPRGGEALIDFVSKNSRVPVIAHYKGLCHIYLDHDAPLERAIKITENAKIQRPGVCNAMETLLIHKDFKGAFELLSYLEKKGVSLRVDQNLIAMFPNAQLATEEDFRTEHLNLTLNVKQVQSLDEAIQHIQKFGTLHTEAIITNTKAHGEKFCQEIDASCVLINASTRFNDGSEFGLGAELGISTSKFHAYGPMGAEEMTTLRFELIGEGHCRV